MQTTPCLHAPPCKQLAQSKMSVPFEPPIEPRVLHWAGFLRNNFLHLRNETLIAVEHIEKDEYALQEGGPFRVSRPSSGFYQLIGHTHPETAGRQFNPPSAQDLAIAYYSHMLKIVTKYEIVVTPQCTYVIDLTTYTKRLPCEHEDEERAYSCIARNIVKAHACEELVRCDLSRPIFHRRDARDAFIKELNKKGWFHVSVIDA